MKDALAVYDEKGRSQKGHQSPFDLKITLASSGAQFIMGWTVNDMHPELASVWYAAKGKGDIRKGGITEAIFCDRADAVHWEPDELKGKLKRRISQLNSGAFQILSALTRFHKLVLFVFLARK